jgi:hypothetical protein
MLALRSIGPSCVKPMLGRLATTGVDQVSEKAVELYAVLEALKRVNGERPRLIE